MIAVNLAVEHLSPIALARSSDVYAAIIDSPFRYDVAARKLGMTTKEYAEFRDALTAGNVRYVVLPRHIDAMTGRRNNGTIYVLRNIVVPNGTRGWEVDLSSHAVVYVPRACGNLSLSRPTPIAIVPRPHGPAFHNFPVPHPAYVPPVPVVFTPDVSSAPSGSSSGYGPEAPATSALPVASGKTGFPIGFFALLAPIVASFSGGSHTAPIIALCSAGSNAMGVCSVK